jgi:excisionase family DNA binding protein
VARFFWNRALVSFFFTSIMIANEVTLDLHRHRRIIDGRYDTMPQLPDLPLVETSNVASPWMTPAQAAKYLGIALGTLRNWTSAHFVPFAKKGRVVRYHREKIDQWLLRGGCAGRTALPDERVVINE